MFKHRPSFYVQVALFIGFCTIQGSLRYYSREFVDVGSRKVFRDYDPRGRDVEGAKKRQEKEFFSIKESFSTPMPWPGLGAMNFSFTWLKIMVR